MKDFFQDNINEQKKELYHKDGITYYSRKTERKIFFVLTMTALIAGVLYKLGIF